MAPTDQHLDAAVAAVAEFGPVDHTLGVTAELAVRWTGKARSTIYRQWPTIADLNGDLADHVDASRGWVEELVGSDPAGPLEPALVAAIATEQGRTRSMVRAVACGWPSAHPARQRIALRERHRVRSLGAWLERWAAAHDRRFTEQGGSHAAAFAVTGLIEGHLLLTPGAVRSGAPARSVAARAGVERAVHRVLLLVTVADGDGDQAWVDVASAAEPKAPAAGAGVLDRIAVGLAADLAAGGRAVGAGRLVDLERLARRQGVSGRRLYYVWPGSAVLNRQVIERVLDRLRAAWEQSAHEAFAAGLSGSTGFADVAIDAFDRGVRLGAIGWDGQPPLFWCSRALFEADTRRELVQQIARWEPGMRTVLIAGHALAGRRPSDGFSGVDLAGGLISVLLGTIRLATLQPDLFDVQVPFQGRAVPITGLACLLVSRALSSSTRWGAVSSEPG